MRMDNSCTNISLDLMGGDLGPSVIILGALRCLETYPGINFLMYGDENICAPLLEPYEQLRNKSTFYHCDVSISMDEKPATALRRGRNVSSMWRAMEAVKENKAAAMVSTGNTGALIAMARLCLNKIDNMDRLSFVAFWPTVKGKSIILDVGATASRLFQLAIIGSALARITLGIKRPSVGLLNIGIEETKGYEELREAGRMLRETSLDNFEYYGFIEANNISHGAVDVIVTEGFSGKVAIKSAAGVARQIEGTLSKALQRTFITRIRFLLVRKALKAVKNEFDPRNFNGGLLLGLDGIIVKGHGSSDDKSMFNAIHVAYNVAHEELVDKIKADLNQSYRSIFDTKKKKNVEK